MTGKKLARFLKLTEAVTVQKNN